MDSNTDWPDWLKAKRNEHVCLPEALVEELMSDPDMYCKESMCYEIEDVAIGKRDVLLRNYIFGGEAYAKVDKSFDRGQPGTWDISQQIYEGSKSTNLHFAVRLKDVPFVYECIRLGADVNCQDIKGQTPLYAAMEEIGGYLLDLAKHNKTQEDASSTMKATLRRLRLIVKVLLEQYTDTGRSPWKSSSPVFWAWIMYDIELLELFALHGASEAIIKYPLKPINRKDHPMPPGHCQFPDIDPAKVSAFEELVSRLVRDGPPVRPPRQCPCLSGKSILECHGLEVQPYPPNFACACGLSKPYDRCCKRRGIDFVERWDERLGRLVVLCRVVDGDTVIYHHPATVSQLMFESNISDDYKKRRKELLTMAIKRNDTALGEKADPAFRYAAIKYEFLPLPISELLTKDVGKFMSGIWNGYVDEYIALATDGRHKLEIEQAAKLDLCYGPLWKRCEASGCVAVEGPALKMKCCAGCRKVYYCSASCQRAQWSAHKPACKSRNHLLQSLRSQDIYAAIINEVLDKIPKIGGQAGGGLSELDDFDN